MAQLLNLEDGNILIDANDQEKLSSPSSCGYKLVPWLNWDEWDWVRVSVFSGSPDKVASAIKRISTWRSRECLPVVVDVTASLVEIQQKDPFFRKDVPSDALHSEQMLAMLYSMAILRLVNCVVEKTRKKTEISIADASAAIGIPRTLIDIRHESSHRDLPSLNLVRDAAVKAIDWIKAYYWVPQMELIPYQRDGSAEMRKKIKSKLQKLSSSIIEEQNSQHEASPVTGKSGKKKRSTKVLKNLVSLYSSASSEFLSVLLNLLLKALDSSNLGEFTENDLSALDDWKIVITKLSNKEPQSLLMLLKAILNMVETQEAMRFEIGTCFLPMESSPETGKIEQLSYLFSWLVGQLKLLKPFRKKNSKAKTEVSASEMSKLNTVLKELLRKCLIISVGGNNQLIESASQIAQLLYNDSPLMEKIRKLKLKLRNLSNPNALEEEQHNTFLKSCSNPLIQQDQAIEQAAKKLEFVKLRLAKRRTAKSTDVNSGTAGRWNVVKSWNPCPIGMLPRDLGFSGCFPVLDINDNNGPGKFVDTSEDAEGVSSDICHGKKRGASSDVCLLDRPSVKKLRENSEPDTEDFVLQSEFKGCLMINGVWKKVSEEELENIKSSVRILI
ncbi:las1-like family protein [Euphorbia peplus]|nr:las1-like family protein [Euphorbia peplus]